jgi:hypothetical protein
MRAVAAALAVLALAGPALAEPDQPCGDRAAMLKLFERGHHEKPAGWRVVDGALLEILIGPTGSWTVLKTTPEGRSCSVDAGQGARAPNPARPL